MNRRWCLLGIFVLVGQCFLAQAQDRKPGGMPVEFKSHRELMQYMAVARSSIISYVMEAEVTWKEERVRLCTECLYYFEFSQVGRHVVAVRHEKVADHYEVGLHGSGRSGDQRIYVSSRDGVRMRRLEWGDTGRSTVDQFDWRAVGLGFCGDFPGRNFEAVSGSIAEWIAEYPIPVQDGIATFNDNPLRHTDAKYQVDLKRGAYPILFEYTPAGREPGYSRWKVSIDKIHGEYLPDKATLECLGSTMTIQFTWRLVNEPIEGGKACCERIASRFNLNFDAPDR